MSDWKVVTHLCDDPDFEIMDEAGSPVPAIVDDDDEPIATMIARIDGDDAKMLCHARLIAAAPDMLKVLQQIDDIVGKYYAPGDPYGEQILSMIEPIIAKAEEKAE